MELWHGIRHFSPTLLVGRHMPWATFHVRYETHALHNHTSQAIVHTQESIVHRCAHGRSTTMTINRPFPGILIVTARLLEYRTQQEKLFREFSGNASVG